MSQPAKAREASQSEEPSMEEILASIRRIISDDDDVTQAALKSAERPPSTVAADRSPSDAKRRQDGTGGRAAAAPAPGRSTPDDSSGRPPNGTPGRTEGAQAASPEPEGPLLSPHATAAVDTAFNSLAHTMLSQNPRTLEDLVRDMLKPMLKAWLDANLPDIVERLVRAEIERVSRRG